MSIFTNLIQNSILTCYYEFQSLIFRRAKAHKQTSIIIFITNQQMALSIYNSSKNQKNTHKTIIT